MSNFPSIIENEDDKPKLNPVCQALIDSNGKCEDCNWINDWTDDHELCVDLEITVGGKVYEVSFWWINPSFIFDIAKSPYNAESAANVLQHMKAELANYEEQVEESEEE